MKNQVIQPIYNERVNATLKGLMEGKTREMLAEDFGLGSWKSLDIYLRRKGFAWDGSNSTYIPAINKAETTVEVQKSSVTNKAKMIIKCFKEMGNNSDPRAIAKKFGFKDHRELGEYMDSKQLFWDSEKKNYYGVMFGDSAHKPMKEVITSKGRTIQRDVTKQAGSISTDSEVSMELAAYLPLLELLLQNKERLLTLLMPEATGTIPRYTVPGKSNTQSIYMTDALIHLLKKFCESRNLKQRDVVEAALIEFFRRYGYQQEVDKLLQR